MESSRSANTESAPDRTGNRQGLYHEAPLKVVLISPYELGRQPFGLAQPAAWLRHAGFDVHCLDLSQHTLDPEVLAGASIVAIHLAMHTATRIAVEALPRIKHSAPDAHLCVYGLYAPTNRDYFQRLGVQSVLGGEFEPALLNIAEAVRAGDPIVAQTEHTPGALPKVKFVLPDRTDLPPLSSYSHLLMPDGSERTVGFAEATRGCKHLCRHCPIVPVYEGRFRAIPADLVLADIDAQVSSGAEHISFGDPDFLNGPTHALRIVRALHKSHPTVTYDAIIKVEHLLRHQDLLPELAATGCLFITSAVEAVDDDILDKLLKNHRREDFDAAARLLDSAGIAMAPTFVAFTPWTTLEGYATLLEKIAALGLVDSVPPVQLSIRLLVPSGSHLLHIPGFEETLEPFDEAMFGYPWRHADPRVDALHSEIRAIAEDGEMTGKPRHAIFRAAHAATYAALERTAPALGTLRSNPIPHHSEPWYCCAEPTEQQLAAF
jgi:radical SAM superfamily enzyme YgiQ (UPF0313 family)